MDVTEDTKWPPLWLPQAGLACGMRESVLCRALAFCAYKRWWRSWRLLDDRETLDLARHFGAHWAGHFLVGHFLVLWRN